MSTIIPLTDARSARQRGALDAFVRNAALPPPTASAFRDTLGRPCTTCGSRSPTAAISAARTACRRMSSARDYRSCRIGAPDLRGDRADRGIFVRLGVEDPPHRRRAAAAPEPRAPGRDARGSGRRGSHADHQRLVAREEGACAEGRRACARHREPRRAGRCDVPGDERRRLPGATVLEGIDAAPAAGLAPIKINMVVKRGVNEHAIVPLARHFRASGHIVRFIEFMDVGTPTAGGWRRRSRGRDCRRHRPRSFRSSRSTPNYAGEVAERWRYRDNGSEIGVIASVTQAFCRDCTRARLSTDGRIYTCLFANAGYDLRALLREGFPDAGIATRSRRSGAAAATATRRSAAPKRRARRRSRCRTSGDEGLATPSIAHARRPAGHVRRDGGRRAWRGAPRPDCRRAPIDALRRQARDRHPDDAGRGARGTGDRLPAQPAARPVAGRDRRGPGRLGDQLGRRQDAPRPRGPGSEDGEAHHDQRLRTGHGVRRPDGRDRKSDFPRRDARAGDAVRPARPGPPARDDLQAGGRSARLRAATNRAASRRS